MRPFRVLHIRGCRGITTVTGAETHLLSLLQGFDPQECEPLLVCLTNPHLGQTPWLCELGQTNLSFVEIPVRNRFSVQDFATLPGLAKRFQADIIHSHDHRADIVGIVAAKILGKPVLATCHGWTHWPADSLQGKIYTWLDRQALRYADSLIVNSTAAATQLPLDQNGPPVVVIPHGLDTKKFDPNRPMVSPRASFFHDKHALIVGMVARLHPNKGQLEFLKAASQLSRSHPSCRFLIVGDAAPGYEEYKHQILRFIAAHGLERFVVITQAPAHEIPAIMANIDIFAAPSHMEPFGLSILEAMAMQKAIVATRVGGIPELIIHDETGLLVPPGDWQALCHMLEVFIRNPEQRSRFGHRARQRVKTHFSLETMVAQTTRVYREMAAWKHQKTQGNPTLRERLGSIAQS